MLQSQLFCKTKKTAPKDEISINAQLLIRAGFIDKLMAGVYTFLPLGWRVMKKIINIHFMGIGGSGMVAAAYLAAKNGYEVSGCDQQESTAYSKSLKDAVKNISVGHDKSHIKGIDLLVVTPAIYYSNNTHPEIADARKKMPVMTWEEFTGKYLQKGKEVIAVAGTHGKSTTTSLLSLVFEQAGLDPTAIVGAKVKEWDANARYGKSNLFIRKKPVCF